MPIKQGVLAHPCFFLSACVFTHHRSVMYSPVYGQDDFADDEDDGKYDEPSFVTAPSRSPSPQPALNSSQPQPVAGRIPTSQSYAAHTPIALNLSHGAAPLLDAHLDDIAPLLDILRCLQLDKPSTSAASAFPSATTANSNTPPLLLHCKAMPQGLKLIVNRNKTLSARGYLKSNLFSHYQINTPPPPPPQDSDGAAVSGGGGGAVSFTVSLKRLLSVLEVNAMGGKGGGGGGGSGGSGGSLFMRVMAGAGVEASEVVLELTDEGSVTTCQLACIVQLEGDDDDTDQLQFASAPVVARGTIPVSSHSYATNSTVACSSQHLLYNAAFSL